MFWLFGRNRTQVEANQPLTEDEPRELEFTAALDAYMIGYVRAPRQQKRHEAETAKPRIAKARWNFRTA